MKSKISIFLFVIVALVGLLPFGAGLYLKKMAKQYREDIDKELPAIYWLEKSAKKSYLSTVIETSLKSSEHKGVEEIKFTHEYSHIPDLDQLLKGEVVIPVKTTGKIILGEKFKDIEPPVVNVISEFRSLDNVFHHYEVPAKNFKVKELEVKLGAFKGNYKAKDKYWTANDFNLDFLELPKGKLSKLKFVQTTPQLGNGLVSYDNNFEFEISGMGQGPFFLSVQFLVKDFSIEKIEKSKKDPTKAYEMTFPPAAIELKDLTFKLAENQIKVKGHAILDEKVIQSDGKKLVDFLKAELEVRVNKSHAKNLFTTVTQGKSKAVTPPEMIDNFFKNYLDKKAIVEEGEDYVSRLKMIGKEMTINGEPFEKVFPKPSTNQAIGMVDNNLDDESLYNMAKEKSLAADENFELHHQSVVVADTILKRNPGFAKAHELKAFALRSLAMINKNENDPTLLNDAEKEINQALAMIPDDPTFLVEKAKIIYEQKRHNEAHELLDKVIHSHPTYALAHIIKAQIYLDQKNDAEVDKVLAKIKNFALNQNDQIKLDFILIQFYPKKGMHKETEALHLKLIANKPTPWNILNYGAYLCNNHRSEEAIVQFDKCLAMADIGMCHFNRGNCLRKIGLREYKAGNLAVAKEKLLEAIKENFEDDLALANLGQVFMKLGDKENANQYYDKACKLGVQTSCQNLEKMKKKK